MSKSNKLVSQTVAYATQDGGLYATHTEAAEAAANNAIEEACHNRNGDLSENYSQVYSNSYEFAKFILSNKPLVRQILGL